MLSKEELLKELDYHGAGCLKTEVEKLYRALDIYKSAVPSWAKIEIEKLVDQNETK